MRIGIVGLPAVGKTTLFNLLTEGHVETSSFGSGKLEAHVGMARVPDRRIDYLSDMYKPRKTIYAQIEFVDVPGLAQGAGSKGVANQFLAGVREADALVEVVRTFENPMVPVPQGSIDPRRDAEALHTELLFADLEIVEKRIERLTSGKKTKEGQAELPVIEKCREILEGEGRIGAHEWTPDEQTVLRTYGFLTEKPAILVVNVDEGSIKGGYAGSDAIERYAAQQGVPVLAVSARTEQELNDLSPEERAGFLDDLGLTESGIERIARAAYAQLGLMSFFTVGEDEVRAWTIHRGTEAKRAAGKVHSDIERGFIRAEVVSYEDLRRVGSMAKLKEQGLFRLEGKDYVMQDGDIVNFRFNV